MAMIATAKNVVFRDNLFLPIHVSVHINNFCLESK